MKNLLISLILVTSVSVYAKKGENDSSAERTVYCKNVDTNEPFLTFAAYLQSGSANYLTYTINVQTSGSNIVQMSLVDNFSGDSVNATKEPSVLTVTLKTDEAELPIIKQSESGYWGSKIITIQSESGDLAYVSSNSRKGASNMSIFLKTDENQKINIICEVLR